MIEPKIVVYQYPICAEYVEGKLTWNDEASIDKLFLGLPWKAALDAYSKRARFYWGFSISGHGEEIFPIIDSKVELDTPSMSKPEFLLEMAVMPEKLNSEQRKAFEELLDSYIKDKKFKLWWDDDPRGPRKRSPKVKKKMITLIKKLKHYAEEDDLKLEDVDVSLQEALKYFEFDKDAKSKDVRKSYKGKFKELVLKHHPDSETGSDSAFIYLEKCRTVLERWIK